jgi:hypothetical protein
VRSGSVFRKWWPVPAAAIAAGALVTGLGGHGGYGLFSSAQTATGTLNAGSVTLGLTGSSSASTSWTISDVAPGDYYEAPLTLSDTGSIGISTVSLSATISTSSTPQPPNTGLYGASTTPSGEDPVYVYALDCQGGTWTHAASGDPYSCTPPSGSSTTPTVTTVLGAVPACASSSNSADLSTCETSSYWMDPSGAVDAVPSGAVGVTLSGIASTPLSLPTVKGASGQSDVLTASGGSQSSANVLLVEYVNPNVTSVQGVTAPLIITFTGTQRAGTLKS